MIIKIQIFDIHLVFPVNTIGEKASTCFILLQNNYRKALQTPTIDSFYLVNVNIRLLSREMRGYIHER